MLTTARVFCSTLSWKQVLSFSTFHCQSDTQRHKTQKGVLVSAILHVYKFCLPTLEKLPFFYLYFPLMIRLFSNIGGGCKFLLEVRHRKNLKASFQGKGNKTWPIPQAKICIPWVSGVEGWSTLNRSILPCHINHTRWARRKMEELDALQRRLSVLGYN